MPQKTGQICTFAATFPSRSNDTLRRYMRLPTLLLMNSGEGQLTAIKESYFHSPTSSLFVNSEEEQPTDVKEYRTCCPKAVALVVVLEYPIFKQCTVYCESLE